MKKIYRGFAACLCVVTIIGLSGCFYKKKTDSESFRAAAEAKGYEIQDVTDRFDPEVGVSKCYYVRIPEENFELAFYAVETQKQAKAKCDQNKKKFENFAGGATGETTGSGNNVKYSLTAEGRYMVNSSIGNTFIYADVPEEKAEDVKAVLNELGY